MPLKCCVPRCGSVWIKNCKISFHLFPKEDQMRQRWLKALGIETLNWQARPRVCSKHFEKNDFVFGSNIRQLSKFTVPKTVSSSQDSSKTTPIPILTSMDNIHMTEMEVEEITTSDIPISPKTQNIDKIDRNLTMMWDTNKENVSPSQIRSLTENISPKISLKISKKHKVKTVVTQVKGTPHTPIEMSWVKKQANVHEKSNTATTSQQEEDTTNHLHSENIPCSQCDLRLKTIMTLENEISYLKQENERLQQVSTPKPVFDIAKFATNNKKISYYTGFPDYNILLNVFRWVLPSGNLTDINCYNSRSSSRKHSTKLSAENQFFLTLVRLRRGMCIETLSDLFSISKATANNIFLTWINLMYLRLGSMDIWPDRNVLLQRASPSMLANFPNIIGSIDCTEFQIQCPSSLAKQSQCYSNYKSTTTVKALLMIGPGGEIIYISPLFTGSISDKAILKNTGFLDILKEKVDEGSILQGDVILADKGFNVQDLFDTVNINLNIPVFRMGGIQFTHNEVATTRKIAKERIHVERAIGRLKTYRILSATKIPIASIGTMQQIYTVCAILCNFKFALIK